MWSRDRGATGGCVVQLRPPSEALGFAPRGAALHANDLAVSEGQNLEALLASSAASVQCVEPMILLPTT